VTVVRDINTIMNLIVGIQMLPVEVHTYIPKYWTASNCTYMRNLYYTLLLLLQ